MILALKLSDTVLDQVRNALPSSVTIARVAQVDELCVELGQVRTAQVLVEFPESPAGEQLREIERLHQNCPWVPIIVLADRSHPERLDVAARLGKIGVEILIHFDEPEWRDRLHRVITMHSRTALANIAWEWADLRLPSAGTTIFKVALRLAHVRATVPQLAKASGMAERTLRFYCQREGLPQPQWIVGWARLLLAACLLHQGRAKVDRVASQLGFHTARDLSTMARRYLKRQGYAHAVALEDSQALRAALEKEFNEGTPSRKTEILLGE